MAENIIIDPEIIDQTTKCRGNYSCLSGEKGCLCEVEEFFESPDGIVFIKSTGSQVCNYKISYGYGWICGCPTRKALFETHGI